MSGEISIVQLKLMERCAILGVSADDIDSDDAPTELGEALCYLWAGLSFESRMAAIVAYCEASDVTVAHFTWQELDDGI